MPPAHKRLEPGMDANSLMAWTVLAGAGATATMDLWGLLRRR
jgi:hypothetical protein